MENVFVHPEMKLIQWKPQIPRDFYNAGTLFNNMARLALMVLDGKCPDGLKIVVNETAEPFEIGATDAEYYFVKNYPVTINGKPVFFATVVNSRDRFPLVCFIGNDEITVFDEDGDFTAEFAAINI
jgi:hypothetical protein